jgi:hypothetical protein
MGKMFENLQEIIEPKNVQIYLQGDLMAIKKSNFACVYMPNISRYDSGERCGPWASCSMNQKKKNWFCVTDG